MLRGNARQNQKAGMAASSPFEETWPVAVVAAPVLSVDIPSGDCLDENGQWRMLIAGAPAKQIGDTVGLRATGKNTSSVGVNLNINVWVVSPSGKIIEGGVKTAYIAAGGLLKSNELKFAAEEAGTYQGHIRVEIV